MDDKATLVNLRYVDGELKQVFMDATGKEIIKDIDGLPSTPRQSTTQFEDVFSKTDTIPCKDIGPKTSPLIRKSVAKELTCAVHDKDSMMDFIQRHMDVTISLHAMMIEILGAPENFSDERALIAKNMLNKNSALKAVVMKQLLLLGDVWKQAYDKLK